MELVGRERELGGIERQLELARGGSLRVLLLGGEPGIGKSSLLGVAAERSAALGAVVLRGGTLEAEGMPPYLPFLEALGRYARAAPLEALRAQLGSWAPVLSTILPELPLRLGQPAEQYPLPPEQERLRLFEAVAGFLAAIAAPTGALLCLDDLQWADPASLDILGYVAGRQRDARLLVATAFREGEVGANPAFTRMLAELSRLRVAQTIVVAPLSEEQVGALARRALGGRLDVAGRRLLFAQSEGNPFYAEELLAVWREAGALSTASPAETVWRLDRGAAPSLPAGVAAAIRQRLARLAPEAVELLRSAAVIGREFDPSLLARVVGQEPETVEALLAEVAGRGLLRIDAATQLVAFSHDKIRECLYDEVTPLRRQRLHSFIGRALESRSAAAPDDSRLLAELAYHFARSGDRERGADYARRAAEQALSGFAPAEALGHFETALGLCRPADPRRGELLLGLGEAAILAGAEERAVAALGEALAWFQTRDDRRAARAAYQLGRAHWRREALAEARVALETALALARLDRGADLVRIQVELANLLGVSLNELGRGLDLSREALDPAASLGDAGLLAMAQRTLGNLLVRANDLPGGVARLEEALAGASAAGDLAEAAECYAYLTVAYFWQGTIDRCVEALERREEIAERTRDTYQLRHVYSWLALCLAIRGRLDEAEDLLAREEQVVERLASPEPLAYLQLARGGLAFQRGGYDEAATWFERALAGFRAIGPGAVVWYLGFPALTQTLRGAMGQALAAVAELEALLETVPPGTMPAAEPLAYLTQLALITGDHERLDGYYPQLLPFAGQFHDFLIDRLLGELETRAGDWAAAERHLRAAEELTRRERLSWELPRVLAARAQLARARGESEATVRALLEAAAAAFERFGNAVEAQRLRDRLAGLSGTAVPAPTALPAGLSRREAEVLALLAAGRSNRAIAEALFISESTVAHHLTSIYTKTAADNRAGAVAFAIRHGLA